MDKKVYTGNKPIKEHVEQLTSLYGMPEHAAHKVKVLGKPNIKPKQSIQVRKLKQEIWS